MRFYTVVHLQDINFSGSQSLLLCCTRQLALETKLSTRCRQFK